MPPKPSDFRFLLEFKVRDYECDLQGIVNNSVYQNYLEHTRHEFLLAKGISFADLTRDGINLVVTRIELDYKRPLRSGDYFTVGLNIHASSAVRGIFEQVIFLKDSEQLVAKAMVSWAAMNNDGRPIKVKQVIEKFQ